MSLSVYLHLILALAVLEPTQARASAGQVLRRCDQFLLPVLGNQILVLPKEAYGVLQTHPISKLAESLRSEGSRLHFIFDGAGGGYETQGAMLKRLVSEIFNESNPGQKWRRTRTIHITLTDSPLRNTPFSLPFDPEWKDPATLQMHRMKAGNPLIPTLAKDQARVNLGIPKSAKVLHVYFDGDEIGTLETLYDKLPVKPDVLILSPSGSFSPYQQLYHFSDHEFIRLSALPSKYTLPAILYNDRSHRMLELYAASDYAIVIGANNIFEPLRAQCPTLIFKTSFFGFPFDSPVSYYHPHFWNEMASIAEASGGAIAITRSRDAEKAFNRLFKIDPGSIHHPAFVKVRGKKSPFQRLLDDLEASIRRQIETGRPPVGVH